VKRGLRPLFHFGESSRLMVSPQQQQLDQRYMLEALELAAEAGEAGEIPVGAIVVRDDIVLGRGRNCCVADQDPTGHAEIVALRAASKASGGFRLDGATLYVTLEPCLMCSGALLQSRISRLVYGAREPKTGAIVSIHDSLRVSGVEHHISVTECVCEDDSKLLLGQFFRSRR